MTLHTLLDHILRPTDYIKLYSEDAEWTTLLGEYDGFEPDIPLEYLRSRVISWEVTAAVKQISLCEINIVYILVVKLK